MCTNPNLYTYPLEMGLATDTKRRETTKDISKKEHN